ncbi:TJAP1 [Cordylochernes scorpioides]|uniref:TJAP1 n=1 Tax=Cordylochernes scorpioides TaxID=51811 RepID=A0ABY6KKJ9_9ARAC|nr:TJAP1 [Cordylochernes scorpioides]
MVDRFQGEKTALTRDISDLTGRLVEARLALSEAQEENEQYRNDCNVAVQLLQCKPSNFVASKLSSVLDNIHSDKLLPNDLQDKVKTLLSRRRTAEPRTIKVEVGSAAMLYAVAGRRGQDYVSAAVLAKVLEERAKERSAGRRRSLRDAGTQTAALETDI